MKSVSPPIGEGIVIDIGTGDGRFVSAAAKSHPNKFFIGVDANRKPLEKPSMRATRKPEKGGLPNAVFVEAAIEALPTEFDSVADEIHIHFPWGSLLRVVATGDADALASLRRIAAPDCLLEIVIGIDPERDRTEIGRLAIPDLDETYIRGTLAERYAEEGFTLLEARSLEQDEWSRLETTWANKLSFGRGRRATYLLFSAT